MELALQKTKYPGMRVAVKLTLFSAVWVWGGASGQAAEVDSMCGSTWIMKGLRESSSLISDEDTNVDAFQHASEKSTSTNGTEAKIIKKGNLCTPLPELQVSRDLKVRSIGPYRLGDMVWLRNVKCANTFNYHVVTWPRSLASMYVKATKKQGDYRVFFDCIHQKYALAERKLKPASLMVVHLRLGDVLDAKKFRNVPLNDFLSGWLAFHPGRNYSGRFYVPPLSAYAHLQIPAGTRRVVLMGNPYFVVGMNNAKSIGYAAAVRARLEQLHPKVKVSFRFPQPPNVSAGQRMHQADQVDDDVFFIKSQAAIYVPSGGGFSYLLAKVAKLAGHTVDFSIRNLRPFAMPEI